MQVGGFFVPGLTERRVETTVEVGSGQTLAIGGLLSERCARHCPACAGLGDVPVLGALFRSVEYQSEESELVVLVTPSWSAASRRNRSRTYPAHRSTRQ